MELIEDLVWVNWGSGHSSLSPTVLRVPLGFLDHSEREISSSAH